MLIEDNPSPGRRWSTARTPDGSDNTYPPQHLFANNASGCRSTWIRRFAGEARSILTKDRVSYKQNREFALTVLARCRALSAKRLPDGRGFNYIIEDNVSNGNGRIGGARSTWPACGSRSSRINLILRERPSGIVAGTTRTPRRAGRAGPKTAADVTAPRRCPSSLLQQRYPNTVLMNARGGRSSSATGAGAPARNNILVNDGSASIEIAAHDPAP